VQLPPKSRRWGNKMPTLNEKFDALWSERRALVEATPLTYRSAQDFFLAGAKAEREEVLAAIENQVSVRTSDYQRGFADAYDRIGRLIKERDA